MKKKDFSSMLALTLLVMANRVTPIKEVKDIIEKEDIDLDKSDEFLKLCETITEDVEDPLDKLRLKLVNKSLAFTIAKIKHCIEEDMDILLSQPIPKEVIKQTAEELATLYNEHISSEEEEETSINENVEALIEDFHAHLRVHGSALVPNGLTEHLVSRDCNIKVEKEHVHGAPFDLLRYAR